MLAMHQPNLPWVYFGIVDRETRALRGELGMPLAEMVHYEIARRRLTRLRPDRQ
jgi:hypothetical protein